MCLSDRNKKDEEREVKAIWRASVYQGRVIGRKVLFEKGIRVEDFFSQILILFNYILIHIC